MALSKSEIYSSVAFSLARRIEDFREEFMPNATYINWDAHATINELPAGDLIGLAGIGLAEDEHKKYEITFGIQIATENDPGLHRMTELISELFAVTEPETKIKVFKAVNGEAVEASWLVAALPRAVTPVQRAEIRAVQAVEGKLLLDPGAASSLR